MNPSFSQLPFNFCITKLQKDLEICENNSWIPHFNKQRYEGNWTSISLRSNSGLSNDIYSFPNKEYKNTVVLDQCYYFKEIVDWFKCEKEAVRVLKLDPNSEIKEHTDNDTSYDEGFFRIHIPIFTNSDVYFYVNNELVSMQMGECWYANFQLPHSVINASNEPRVHRTIDCIRNSWSDELFAKMGFEINSSSITNQYPDELKQKIIAELMRNPNETTLQLISDLKAK